MANPTQQSMAVNGINRLLILMQQFQTFRAAVNDYVTQYGDMNWGTVWDAFATAPLNADGSLGTADPSPNNAHPIDTRVIGGLNCCMAAADIVNGVATFQALQTFLTGSAQPAQANRNAVIDKFQAG